MDFVNVFKGIICYNINRMDLEQRMKTFNVSREIVFKKYLIGQQIISKYRKDNKDKIIQERKERQKEYRVSNKEKIAERQKEYNEANKEKIVERKKKYYEDNKEKIAERKKKYRDANKEKIAEYRKKYKEANKNKIAEQKKEYYLKKKYESTP